MVTLIRGTKKTDGSHALKSAALIAAVSYQLFNRKTLVLQISNNGRDLEYYLNGKTEAKSLFGGEEIDLSEMGIDALMLRAEGERVTREHFESLTDDIINGSLHLDIAPRSKTKNIEETILANIAAFHELLRSAAGDSVANAPYDNVIVVMKYDNEALSEELRKMVDHEIICVGQGEPEFEPKKESKSFFKKNTSKDKCQTAILVQDYEPDSRYNIRFIKKAYDATHVYVLPHNVLFNDAIAGGRLVSYINRNIKVDKTDYNYALFDSIQALMNYIFKKAAKEDRYEENLRKRDKKKTKRGKYEIPEGSVEVYDAGNKKQEAIQIAIDPNMRGETFSSVMWEEMPRQTGYVYNEPQYISKKKKPKKERTEEAVYEPAEEEYVEEYEEVQDEYVEEHGVSEEETAPVMHYAQKNAVAPAQYDEQAVYEEDFSEFDEEETDVIEELEDLPSYEEEEYEYYEETEEINHKEMSKQEAKLAKKKKKGGLFGSKPKKNQKKGRDDGKRRQQELVYEEYYEEELPFEEPVRQEIPVKKQSKTTHTIQVPEYMKNNSVQRVENTPQFGPKHQQVVYAEAPEQEEEYTQEEYAVEEYGTQEIQEAVTQDYVEPEQQETAVERPQPVAVNQPASVQKPKVSVPPVNNIYEDTDYAIPTKKETAEKAEAKTEKASGLWDDLL